MQLAAGDSLVVVRIQRDYRIVNLDNEVVMIVRLLCKITSHKRYTDKLVCISSRSQL